jgi:hypothetical protein
MSCAESNLTIHKGRNEVFNLVATDSCTGDAVDLTGATVKAFLTAFGTNITLSSDDEDQIEITDAEAGEYSILITPAISDDLDDGDIISVEVSAEFPTETINHIGKFYFAVKGAQPWPEPEE